MWPPLASKPVGTAISRDDLFGACQALFGPEARPGEKFLAGLDTAALRRQFRRKAMDVHPDRAATLRGVTVGLGEDGSMAVGLVEGGTVADGRRDDRKGRRSSRCGRAVLNSSTCPFPASTI